jgi:hypothetical protein
MEAFGWVSGLMGELVAMKALGLIVSPVTHLRDLPPCSRSEIN